MDQKPYFEMHRFDKRLNLNELEIIPKTDYMK